jgi:hypothetical protein
LTPRIANTAGTFDTTTRPTLAQVEAHIDQISGIVNSYLAQAGFAVPVTQADVKLALTMFVQEEVAAMAEGVNGQGRFGPTTKTPGKRGRFAVITEDVKAFIEGQAYGFQLLGATQTTSIMSGVAFRDADESGNSIAPIFERKAYGNTFKEWDS